MPSDIGTHPDTSLAKARALFDRSIAVKAATRDACLPALVALAKDAVECLVAGGKLMFAGNGGSAADAQHIAAEFLVRLRPHVNRRAIPAMALTLDPSSLTATGNDYGFKQIYARTIEGLGRGGDVFVGITTSGRSPNILAALETARGMGVVTGGFLGAGGGAALELCDHAIVVPSDETGRVQEMHITLGHALAELVEDEMLRRGLL